MVKKRISFILISLLLIFGLSLVVMEPIRAAALQTTQETAASGSETIQENPVPLSPPPAVRDNPSPLVISGIAAVVLAAVTAVVILKKAQKFD